MDKQSQLTMTDKQNQDNDEINLMELLLVVAKHNRFIIKWTGIAALLAIALSLIMTNIYTAEAVLLPPQQAPSTASMLLGQLGGLAGGSMGIKNPSDQYVGMLKSRTVADALIMRFNLQKKYDQKFLTKTRKMLEASTNITAGKDGFITVQFSDIDPKFAAELTNAYVTELEKLTQTLAITEAAKRRLFFEIKLKAVNTDLANAEIALKQTQEKTGLMQLGKQGEAIIQSIADLRAQVAAKEVELAAMHAFATDKNPDYRQLLEVIGGLKVQLSKLERDNISGNGDVMVASAKMPALGLDYIRKARDVKYQETLFELMGKQYELAKIDEVKEAAVIQVVDKAVIPDRKSGPKRALIVILATMLAFFVTVILAFFKEANAKASNNPESAQQLSLLRRYLRFGA